MPSAFDEAGIRMLDSIREIFDLADFKFESVDFEIIRYNYLEEIAAAIRNGKYPVADVCKEYIKRGAKGSHAMLATGIKYENGIGMIQLKNPYANNSNEQGKVQKIISYFADLMENYVKYI